MTGDGHGIGIPGVEIESRDHICALFEGEAQRDEILFSFLQEGLRDGDKCMVVLGDDDPSEVLGRFADARAIEEWRASGALDVRGAAPARVAGDELTVAEMLALWDDAVAATDDSSPYDFVRVAGDATWWMPQTEPDTLVRYESEFTRFMPDRLAALCLYDVTRVSGSLLIDTVRSHPRILAGSVVIENPYYLPPEALERARHGPGGSPGPGEHEIHQLASLLRLDLSQSLSGLVCRDCGTVLFAAASTTEGARPHASAYLTCLGCGAEWEQGADGGLTKRPRRVEGEDPG